jgi:imidazolonepropionase-like amidohydrolase
MFIAFSELPDSSRIWVYQSDKILTEAQQQTIAEEMKRFVESWTAHKSELQASFEIRENRFLILGLNEQIGKASGCSIDRSVDVIKGLGEKMGINLLQNAWIAYQKDQQIGFFDFKEAKNQIETGQINSQTQIYDLSISTKAELSHWPKPAHKTWLNRYFITVLFWALSCAFAFGQKKCFSNATLHLGNGKVIEKGFLSFENDKIVALGSSEPNSDCIDLQGAHIYPGFILLNTTLGLREIDALRPTLDYEETGELNPNISSAVAFNNKSEIIPTLRLNGVLLAQPTPRGSLLAGQSSAFVLLDEGGLIAKNLAHHLYWRSEKSREIEDLLSAAKLQQTDSRNLKLASLRGLFDGSQKLFLHCESNSEAILGIELCRKLGVQKIVWVCGEKADLIAKWLKNHDIEVILPRVFDLPNEENVVETVFSLPAKMLKAGVTFALNYQGDMEAMGARNLPFSCGQTVAFGLNKEQALKLICLNAAKILGIEKDYGSLEIGKSATFFISKGDALDIATNEALFIFIGGKEIPLSSRQIELYKKYNR